MSGRGSSYFVMFYRITLGFLIVSIIILTLTIANNKLQSTSPNQEITQARQAIAMASKANTDHYARPTLSLARGLYDSAMNHWKKENNRFILLRDFEKARTFAQQANHLALSAMQIAKTTESELKTLVSYQVKYLREKLNQYQIHYSKIPLNKGLNMDLANAKLLFHEGLLLYNKGDFKTSKSRLDNAEFLIAKVNGHARVLLEEYFEHYNEWIESINKTIAKSANEQTSCLIIDKYGRTCQLYSKGNLIGSFEVELGSNWIGDKMYQGDKSTPEGTYRVIRTKADVQTKYHKALLINYPNDEDKKRFSNNQKRGKIKTSALIGGLIEIHGHGGKGIDWTDGCVALANQDMDLLFSYCNEGTAVTIVGSLRSLEEIMQSQDN